MRRPPCRVAAEERGEQTRTAALAVDLAPAAELLSRCSDAFPEPAGNRSKDGLTGVAVALGMMQVGARRTEPRRPSRTASPARLHRRPGTAF